MPPGKTSRTDLGGRPGWLYTSSGSPVLTHPEHHDNQSAQYLNRIGANQSILDTGQRRPRPLAREIQSRPRPEQKRGS